MRRIFICLLLFALACAPSVSDADARRAASLNEQGLAKFQQSAFPRALQLFLDAKQLNPAEADDVAQAAFFTAWRKIGSFRGGSFKARLCPIAYREFLQARRKQKPEVEFDENAHIISFDTSAAALGDRLDLERALKTLPENQRICVVLCVASGLSHSEAAAATGFPLGTVKSHVNRGVETLRKRLATHNVA